MLAEDEGVLKCISTVCAIRVLRGIRRSEVYIIADLIKPEYLPIKLPFPGNRDKPPCGRECSVCKMYVVEKSVLNAQQQNIIGVYSKLLSVYLYL